MYSFSEQMSEAGHKPTTQNRTLELVTPEEDVANQLNLKTGEKAYKLVRLRLADGVPLMYGETYLPERIFPDLKMSDLEDNLYTSIQSFSLIIERNRLMFTKTDAELKKMGADITTREIQQQSSLWKETFKIYKEKKTEIDDFLAKITKKFDKVKVIFTGAGTSAYVGNTVMPYLRKHGDRSKYDFEAIDTTKIVSTPEDYLEADTPTILVSFARSGNSPESVATVELAKQLVTNLYQIAITCAPEGHLAQDLKDDPNGLVLLMPAKSLDQGFAMTGSFSCMSLATLLVFDTRSDAEKEAIVNEIAEMGQSVIDREDEIQKLVDTDFDRITYIGSGALGGLAEEARLKILELTAGKVAALFDTSMGLRHGPKSFLDKKTIVFDFVSNNT